MWLTAHPPRTRLLLNPNRLNSLPQRSLYLSNSPLSFTPRFNHADEPPKLRFSAPIRRRTRLVAACNSENLDYIPGISSGVDDTNEVALVSEAVEIKGKELESRSIWNQMKEIAMFTGPATGLWLCGPLMSLIDTVVIGQGSTIELAALGTNYSVF